MPVCGAGWMRSILRVLCPQVTRFAESGGADGRDEPASTAAEDCGLRASLRAIWSSVAPSWGELAEHVDTRGAVVAQAMLDSAGLQRGDPRSVACGPGGLGMAAAAIVGPGGRWCLRHRTGDDSDRRRASEKCRPNKCHNLRSGPRADRLP